MYALRTYINHILRQQFECNLCASHINISTSFKSCAGNLGVGPVYASLIKNLRKSLWVIISRAVLDLFNVSRLLVNF